MLSACGERTPAEEAIRERIEGMRSALGEGRTRSFMAPVADDFTALGRDLDRRAARLLLTREMMAHQRLKARLFDLEVELLGDARARATLHAVVTGGSGLVPDTGSWYRVTTGWRLDGGEWMLISAGWEPVAGRG
jgi:hypothetical protein